VKPVHIRCRTISLQACSLQAGALAAMLAVAIALLVAMGSAAPADLGATQMGKHSDPRANAKAGSQKKNADDQTDLVITPGGMVRRNNVHQVAPNQAVRNKDGTLQIVPRTDRK